MERIIIPKNVNEVENLYLSGPMTGYPKHNFSAFEAGATQLRGAGYKVFSPHEVKGEQDWGWADYMRADFPGVLGAQGIAVLDGWTESRGARAEVDLAHLLGAFVLPKDVWLSYRLTQNYNTYLRFH
ncbi:DUF4406 domain-containing protein [Candidatus Saccharibacteria bacterium]|nr:MAG: DUF4406 domain-containing protein [Candidatus Saccharibacteria bacterium]